ncbi:PrsW family glutamic-type intramembrane protease [Agrococcus baldri]|nr:PrsW family glutamic-type intramembrane protease [Agrococcus baldri]
MQGAPTAQEPRQASADPVDRWQYGVLAWRSRHPQLSRAIEIVRLGGLALALVSLGIAAVLEQPVRVAVVQALLFAFPVAVMLLLTRTRGIGVRFALTWLAVSAMFAPVVALLAWAASAVAGVGITDDGASVAIAAVVEEAGKLVPFAVWAIIATNRVRRWTTTDFLVVGWLSGTGFSLVEESLRLTVLHTATGLSMLETLFGDADPRFTLNPLGLSYGDDPSPVHPVWTALVLGMLGLALALRRRYPVLRWLTWALPLGALLTSMMDHGLGNAGLDAWTLLTGDAHPLGKALAVPWLLTAQGVLLSVAVAVLWLVAALLDADRRARAGMVEARTLERMARIAQGPPLRRLLAAAAGLGLQIVDDARSWALGVARAIRTGGRLGMLLLPVAHGANADARSRAAALPALDRAAMRRLRVRIAIWLVAGLLLALVLATLLASSIGVGFAGPLMDFWLLNLLENISEWWNGLDPRMQILLMAGAFGILAFAGLSAIASLTVLSWVTFGLSYGGPLARVIDDPSRMQDYLANTSKRQILADLVQLVLSSPVAFRAGTLSRLLSSRFDDLSIREADEIITAIVDTTRLTAAGPVAEGFVRTLEDLRRALRDPRPMWPNPGWAPGT